MSSEACRPASGILPDTKLRVAEQFLRRREFDDCKKYALKAQQSNPNLPGLPQILAVADVLLAAQTRISETQANYYSILNLKPFSQDTKLLNEKFMSLIAALCPSNNQYPFADEALQLVRSAWCVLSNPLKKTQFDSLLKNGFENGNDEKVEKSCGNSENMDTFWTVCPYCYYVYEYAKVYEDCCLRCWNEKCQRGFHGFAINSPPADVLRAGKFLCSGFYPVGFDLGKGDDGCSSWNPFSPKKNDGNEEGGNVGNADNVGGNVGNDGCSSWTPFSPKKNDGNEEGGNVGNADNVGGWDNFVEVCDDGEDSSCGGHKFEESSKEMETGGMNVEFDESCKKMETVETNAGPTISKPVTKRMKKSVGKNTKKLTGTGVRVRKRDVVDHTGASNGEEDMGSGFRGGMEMEGGDGSVMGKVEFFNGEDDVFVSFDDM